MNQTFVVIWVALAVSQLVYIFVPAPIPENASTLPNIFPIALAVVALIQAVGIVVLLRVRAFAPVQSGRIDPTSTSGTAQLFTTLILAWVLAESIAIYGLVLRFLHFSLPYSASFAAAGALLLFVGRPWHPRLRKPDSTVQLARTGTPIE
jgi:F0F1-type ATP synthase membrane subunit c/vacuolar-type H+-ATPase subunit K